jgi:hypothetical protein
MSIIITELSFLAIDAMQARESGTLPVQLPDHVPAQKPVQLLNQLHGH